VDGFFGLNRALFHFNLIASNFLDLLSLHRQHGHLHAGSALQILPNASNLAGKLKRTTRFPAGFGATEPRKNW
jgi:hypothetical protein